MIASFVFLDPMVYLSFNTLHWIWEISLRGKFMSTLRELSLMNLLLPIPVILLRQCGIAVRTTKKKTKEKNIFSIDYPTNRFIRLDTEGITCLLVIVVGRMKLWCSIGFFTLGNSRTITYDRDWKWLEVHDNVNYFIRRICTVITIASIIEYLNLRSVHSP